MFLESILFLQKQKNFKNSVALFWRLSRGSSKSHATIASSQVGFGDLFASERSSREGYTKIFAAQLATPSQVRLPVAKNTLQIFSNRLAWSVLASVLATCISREKCMFCISKIVFKTFSVFPSNFLCLFTFSLDWNWPKHSVSSSSNSISASSHLKIFKKKVWVFSVSFDFSCFEYYLLDFWAVTMFWDILCLNIFFFFFFCLDCWVWVGCFCCWFHLLIIIYSLCANLCSELSCLLSYILIRFMGLELSVIYSVCEFGCLKMSAVLVWLTDLLPISFELTLFSWFKMIEFVCWVILIWFCVLLS